MGDADTTEQATQAQPPARLIERARAHIEKANALIVELARDHSIQFDVSAHTVQRYGDKVLCNTLHVDRVAKIL